MFTNNKAKYYGDNKVLLDSACLSTDTKPTTGVANGSKCIEMDTGKTYMFNEEDSEWEELPSSGGGGGGSSDFSTAEVTIVGNVNAAIPYVVTEAIGAPYNMLLCRMETLQHDIQVPLYKGKIAIELFGDGITVSGNIEAIGPDLYLITGDCAITISGGAQPGM